jgi:outer membrane protein assembly factor BamB
VGQLMKLDPRNRRDPIVWSIAVTERGDDGTGGLFSTPAIDGAYLYASTNAGSLFAVRRDDGRIVWRTTLAEPTWSSPVVVDGVLIQGDCEGVLHGFDVSRPPAGGRVPGELWSVQLEGCIEATPAVWKGRIYVGTREGGIYAIGDRA